MKIEAMRRLAVASVVLLLLGGGAWGLSALLDRSPSAPDPAPRVRLGPPEAMGEIAPGAGDKGAARLRPAPDAGARADAAGGADRASAAGAGDAEAAALPFAVTPLDREAFGVAPPAQVASPFGLPATSGRRMGGSGGVGPTGHWTRFHDLPPRAGTATLAVRVVDTAGRPVAGAEVYLAPPAALEAEAVSFGDLRRLGRTDAAGRLDATGLPAGAGAAAANVHGRLNMPGGLGVGHARGVLLAEGERFAVELTLPFDTSAFGTVTGRVVDAEDAPIRSASVATAMRREWSADDGGFRLEGVPAGTNVLAVGATGREGARVEVDVPAGGLRDVVVRLEHADRGTLRVEGEARLPDGTPVADAPVYVLETGARGTLRRTRTDAHGAFVLADLPDRLRAKAFKIQVSGFPRYRTGLLELPEGVRDGAVAVTVPGAYAQVELRLVDGATGAPLVLADVDFQAEGEGEGRRRAAPLSFDAAKGVWRGFVEGERGRVRAATLTHGTWEETVTLPEGGALLRLEAKLARRAPDPVQVALEVSVLDANTETPIERARVEVLDRTSGEPLGRLEGARPGGTYRLPAPSGTWTLRVSADGHATWEGPLALSPDRPEHRVEVVLAPGP